MVNDIILAIAEAIRTKYDKQDYRIYTKYVEQSFQEPCFFIKSISQSQQHMLDIRYKYDNAFVIHYFNDNQTQKSNCYDVANTLYDLLEFLDVNNQLCRGTGLNSRIEDGVLLFFVNYNAFALKESGLSKNYMQEVKTDGKTKGS
jgi:hypothetical protein